MDLEKLSKELSHMGNIDGWDKMVKHVALMVLEAKIESLDTLKFEGRHWDMDSVWIINDTIDEQIFKLQKEINTLNDG